MATPLRSSLHQAQAVLATMHGKERVIIPLLHKALGLHIDVPANLNTDRFGSFSRDIPRIGSPLDAARAKIAAAFEQAPQASIGVASEGSFGPHPQAPFVPIESEIVLLQDRRSGLEIVGHYLTSRTNFAQMIAAEPDAAMSFAERSGFPAHGIIVIGTAAGKPDPSRLLRKDIDSVQELRAAVAEAIALCGAAHVETDMRAHRNPVRMRAIKRATIDLVRRYRSQCPRCARPGFAVTERLSGLPCGECGEATDVTRAEVLLCAGCAHRIERPCGKSLADPARCDYCNP
ncbi:MAG: DUF6671 family protein [Rhodanobacter sp.]